MPGLRDTVFVVMHWYAVHSVDGAVVWNFGMEVNCLVPVALTMYVRTVLL